MATIATACGGELTTCAGTTTHWPVVAGVTRDATHVRSGSYALKMSASASTAYVRTAFTARHVIVRFSLYMPSVPAVQLRVVASSISSRHLFLNTDGKLSFFSADAASTLPLNEWVTIDLEWDTSANPHTYDWKINGVAQTQATSADAAADITDLYIGDNTGTVTADWWYDDIAISLTDGDYPIPDGSVGGDPEVWTNTPLTPVWTTPADTVSMSTTPELKFTSPASAVAQHFYLQLDTSSGFASGDLRTYDSSTDQTNWSYWTGAAWASLPSTGLASTYAGNEVRYTVTSALSSATWYRRVRAGTLA